MISGGRIPIPLIRRRDLLIYPQTNRGVAHWCVKDPLSLAYFKLSVEEYFLLERLDGRASIESLKAAFERQFAPRRIQPRTIVGLAARFREDGLAIAIQGQQCEQLWEQRRERRSQRFLAACANILAIRMAHFHPRRVLNWATPRLSWLFSPTGILIVMSVIAVGLFVLLADSRRFIEEMSRSLARPDWNLVVAVFLVVAALRTWHELGHAVCCRRFGGDCHEMGVMLVVFAPCLYCNVSDSWTFPTRYQRLWVAAAGVYVEAMAAAMAAIGWFVLRPDTVASRVCSYVVIAGGVNTLLVNGNPLLRLDGYYVMSDVLGVPNLMGRSRALLVNLAYRVLLGVAPGRDEPMTDRNRLAFAAYGVLSLLYRLLIVGTVVWCLHVFLDRYRLSLIAWLATALILAPLATVGIWRVAETTERLARRGELRRGRAWLGVLVSTAVIGGTLTVPLPRWTTAVATVEPRDARRVYAVAAGTLKPRISLGEAVQEGQILGDIHEPSLELEVTQLAGEVERLARRVESLESRRTADDVSAELALALEQLEDAREQLAEKRRQKDLLTLRAPGKGLVFPGESLRDAPLRRDELPHWHGHALDPWNAGCYVRAGDMICQVGPPDQIQISMEVRQEDVAFIAEGQAVSVELDQYPTASLPGTIDRVARIDTRRDASDSRKADDDQKTPPGESQYVPADVVYLAKATLSEAPSGLLPGGRGMAHIRLPAMSIWERLRRAARWTSLRGER